MRVLVVEDNPKVKDLVVRVLGEEGYPAEAVVTGTEALERLAAEAFDLVVLDGMLPDVDGLDVCARLRATGSQVPILMLTARGTTKDKVVGLRAGADDYLPKPFEVEELVARVEALLRRTAGASHGRIRVGPLEIDPLGRRLYVEGRAVDLTTKEYALLLYLAQRCDRVVPRAELLERVWDTPFDPGSNLIEVTVSRVRDKLGEGAWHIETVRGKGYRLRSKPPA